MTLSQRLGSKLNYSKRRGMIRDGGARLFMRHAVCRREVVYPGPNSSQGAAVQVDLDVVVQVRESAVTSAQG